MGMFDWFRRPPAIGDAAALADFIDRNAAFLIQKGIYEYSRARAGPYSRMLLVESTFVESANAARWRAFPLGLAMVAEAAEGVLREPEGRPDTVLAAAVAGVALGVFDRYPVPPALDDDAWAAARDELDQRLGHIALHPRKLAKDIPEPYAERYFSLMPIHERLRGEDAPTLRSYLRITLCNIHAEFVRGLDRPALIAALRAGENVDDKPRAGTFRGVPSAPRERMAD